jgi:hypothetical protein
VFVVVTLLSTEVLSELVLVLFDELHAVTPNTAATANDAKHCLAEVERIRLKLYFISMISVKSQHRCGCFVTITAINKHRNNTLLLLVLKR